MSPDLPPWTACIVVHDRDDALHTLLQALERCHPPPSDAVVVWMNEAPTPLPSLPFPVHTERCDHPDGLPLAHARNRALERAGSEVVVFLAPDCIPHTYLPHHLLPPLQARGGLHMLDVRYLPPGAVDRELPSDFELEVLGVTHPGRPPTGRCRALRDATHFRGTAFAAHRSTLLDAGGFDVRYLGPLGCDAELAARLARADVPVWQSAGRAWHRHHPEGPSDLRLLVENANRHRAEHAAWILTDRLHAHARAGRIDWQPGASQAVLRGARRRTARAG